MSNFSLEDFMLGPVFAPSFITAVPLQHARRLATNNRANHGASGSHSSISRGTRWFDGSDESLRPSDSTMRQHSTSRQLELPLPPAQPTFRAADKVYLKPADRVELARRLRQPRDWRRGLPDPLYIYRYGLDDLRLYNALEAAGLAGIVLVSDRIEDADVVLATQRKRTGKDLSLVNAEQAARKSRLPFFELKSISPERIFEILGPMMGLGSRLRQRQATQNSFQLLPRAIEDGSQNIIDLL